MYHGAQRSSLVQYTDTQENDQLWPPFFLDFGCRPEERERDIELKPFTLRGSCQKNQKEVGPPTGFNYGAILLVCVCVCTPLIEAKEFQRNPEEIQ